MSFRLRLNQNTPSRQDKCKAWLVERGITLTQLAREMGVSSMMISHIIAGRKAPKARIEQLKKLGIPAELLPEPGEPKKRGPKPKSGD
jgi:transcriptional regulator with XRE-family HTH domain